MKKINKILIAVELDKESETVIEYGITLGLMLDATVRCLHVTRPVANRIVLDDDGISMDDFSDLTDNEDIQDLLDSDEKQLRSMVHAVLEKMNLDEYTVMTNVRSDFAIPGILNEAQETSTDLIVVGAHVDFRRKDMSVSNLAKEVIDKYEKSIVVVPSTYGNRNLDHISMLVNFEFGELTMIQDMLDVAIKNNIHMSLVHLLDDEEKVIDVEKKMNVYKRLFSTHEHDKMISFELKAGQVSHMIDELTNDMQVDLICLRTKKKHWNLFGLQQSFDTKVMNHIKVPLYVWKG